MSNFLITTTPVLEGYSIKRYIGAINTNIVLGTNFFSDFAASFTDVFGGTSDTYQGKMDLMYDKAKKLLIKKAQSLGGNAIVGFSTDFDEISGKGKSMFMLSASGTACVVELPQKEEISKEVVNNAIDYFAYENEIKKNNLKQKISEIGNSLDEEDWNFIIEHSDKDIIESLVKDQYVRENEDGKQKIESLLSVLEYDDAVNLVYPLYASPYLKNRKYIYGPAADDVNIDVSDNYFGMIKNCKLFNASQIIKLIDINANKAAKILDSPKECYTEQDIKDMRLICDKFDSLPDVGHLETVKGGMFSKDKEVLICQHGHKNELHTDFCETCSENIKGITSRNTRKIDDFKKKVDILEEMIKREH